VFHSIEKQIASAFRAHIQVRYGIDLAVAIEQPRQSEFGELAVPAAFQLAKQLRQAPKKIASELAEEVGRLHQATTRALAARTSLLAAARASEPPGLYRRDSLPAPRRLKSAMTTCPKCLPVSAKSLNRTQRIGNAIPRG